MRTAGRPRPGHAGSRRGGGAVTVHDVIRDFLHAELGDCPAGTAAMGCCWTRWRRACRAPRRPRGGVVTAWWELPESARYLWEHLIEHMLAAGRSVRLRNSPRICGGSGARLQASGPAGPYADLALIGTPRAERLARVLAQAAHLLAPTDPPHSLIDILYSRVSHDPDWAAQARVLAASRKLPALINKWPPPDLPDPALRTHPHRPRRPGDGGGDRPGRHLARHRRRRRDGADLGRGHRPAARRPHRPHRPGDGGGDRPGRHLARHRRPTTGRCGSGTRPPARSAPPSPATPARVTAVAIAPDGTWLATASDDGTVRIWDPATGQQRATLTGHTGRGDARWRSPRTAPGSPPPAATGRCGSGTRPPASRRATLTGHTGRVTRGGDRPGRHLARHRQRRRDGADLGRGHRPAARHPHRPHRRGDGGGDRPGRHLARHRRRRPDGADLGRGHRPAAAPPSPATPAG